MWGGGGGGGGGGSRLSAAEKRSFINVLCTCNTVLVVSIR